MIDKDRLYTSRPTNHNPVNNNIERTEVDCKDDGDTTEVIDLVGPILFPNFMDRLILHNFSIQVIPKDGYNLTQSEFMAMELIKQSNQLYHKPNKFNLADIIEYDTKNKLWRDYLCDMNDEFQKRGKIFSMQSITSMCKTDEDLANYIQAMSGCTLVIRKNILSS